jgi:uncharacterized protein (DUF4415 family)
MTDEEIDYSEIPELDEEWFKKATWWIPEPKVTITIRIDKEILDWLKTDGPGYQTRINAILGAYIDAQEKQEARERKARKVKRLAAKPAKQLPKIKAKTPKARKLVSRQRASRKSTSRKSTSRKSA